MLVVPSIQNIAAGTVIAGFLGLLIRGIYRLIRNNEASQDFVYDMATNHLPHIYDALTKLCENKGISLGEPPPIQFVRKHKEHDR